MRSKVKFLTLLLPVLLTLPASGSTIYNNLTPNNQMAMVSNPGVPGTTEREAADDFLLTSQSLITSATFVGLFVPGIGGTPGISSVDVEFYRIFPLDSNTVRTITVPTRANSPSDVDFAARDSAAGQLTITSTVLSANFTASNSVQPGGIHPSPLQTTGGNGAITGEEVQITVTFSSPVNLAPDHYFFIPQVALTNGGQFYWLSGSRPISGPGTTPFSPDLQAWIRDANLSPDWLRVGTDIVGGPTPPTFNAAFSLDGAVLPEPGTVGLLLSGLLLLLPLRKLR